MGYKKEVLQLSRRFKIIAQNKSYLLVQARYGPSPPIKLPLKINEDLSCFVGAIIGDGHLRKDKYAISIEVTNKELLTILSRIVLRLFGIKTTIRKVK